MTKIFMLPKGMSLGIGRVVSAYRRYLPDYGFTFVDNINQADLVVMHAGEHASRPADITHNHGLYPTATLMPGMEAQNARVIHNLRTAKLVTVPSQWVADQVRRNMLFNPYVVPHGIEPDEWIPNADPGKYILWAKGHEDAVCDASPVNEVAAKLPQYRFVTTFGKSADNVTVIGAQSYDKIKEWITGAGVYLATTRETFGIQTLEAMACGVPIVGWNWGCTPDIVGNAEGLLSAPRDIDALAANLDYMMQHVGEYRQACIEQANRYSWKSVVRDYLMPVYRRASAGRIKSEPDVSVIITCRNYEKWVGEAIQSALDQNYNGSVEIIVVDDASTDNSLEKIRSFGSKVRLLSIKDNVGAAMARNIGIQHASAPIIASLDADDNMLPIHLSSLVPLLNESGVGIAYGKLIVEHNGRQVSSNWPTDFSFRKQAMGYNCIPSASVFLKEAWRRVGGYSSQFIRGEDAEFWLRIASIGYDVRYVSKPVYVYRQHGNSISTRNKETDWVGDKPWSSDPALTPFAAPASGYDKPSYPVYNYDEPWVTVVVPVGPGHETIVWRAVESVMKQSMPYWECVVVNDSGKDMIVPATGELLQNVFPFIRVVVNNGNLGVSASRNAGASVSKAGLLSFLDADDAMTSHYLYHTIEAYRQNTENYIYTDWMNQASEKHAASEFSCELLRREAIHPVTALVPRVWHDEIGGFDPDMPGWEDWDYYLKLSQHGHCGLRVPMPLVVYDYSSGVRRDYSRELKLRLQSILNKKYRRDNMSCNSPGCKKNNPVRSRPAASRLRQADVTSSVSKNNAGETVMVRFNLGSRHRQGVRGRATRIFYGKKVGGDVFEMHKADQRLQPQIYEIVGDSPEQMMSPMARSASPPIAPPAPFPVVSRVSVVEEHSAAERVTEEHSTVERVTVEPLDDEIDIATLPLSAIKRLDLDPETALTALEVEQDGRKRKAVLEYLEMLAASAIEAAAEYDHGYDDEDEEYEREEEEEYA